MRIKGSLKEFLSVELILLWLVRGVVSDFLFNSNGVNRLNFHNSLLTSSHVLQLALVSISLPWTISGNSITTNTTKPKVKASKVVSGRPRRSTAPTFKRRKLKNYPQKQTSANNALLANIDFLTQLTNTKQEKSAEMDPLKCFPKALCGLSAESAAITRKRKNGLISDYIRLIKAVALNPSVMDKTLKKLQRIEDQKLDDEDKGSTEEEQDDDDEEDEEENDDMEKRRPNFNKRTAHQGYGYYTVSKRPSQALNIQTEGPAKKRTKRKETIPKNSEEFTKQYLQEKAHVERLLEDGFYNEETESQNWWAYENEKEPELEDLVDWSGGTKLDSAENHYTFGAKRKPDAPTSPERPDTPPEPQAPQIPFMPMPMQPPPSPQPPPAPIVRLPENSYDSVGAASTIGNFFRNLFGFGSSSGGGSFKNDVFFQGFQRSLPDGTPTVVTVDKTKEILTTAIEIGETLRTPNQCNSLFNGCKYQYIELLHVIDDIRESLAKRSGKDDESLYTGNDDENYFDAKADDTHSSYGYKSSLSEASQAETLSPDYNAAASAVTGKNRRRKKKKPSFRGEKLSSMSRESSVEIGSDEPTMYGSGQQNYDFNEHENVHHSPHHHHHQNRPPHYNHQQSYQFEDMYVRQPKTIWGTILSWFGFR